MLAINEDNKLDANAVRGNLFTDTFVPMDKFEFELTFATKPKLRRVDDFVSAYQTKD